MKSDPRDETRAVSLKTEKPDNDTDTFVLFSLLSSMAAILWRYKFAAWGSLFFAVSSCIRARKSVVDYKQLVMTAVFAVFSVWSAFSSFRLTQS